MELEKIVFSEKENWQEIPDEELTKIIGGATIIHPTKPVMVKDGGSGGTGFWYFDRCTGNGICLP